MKVNRRLFLFASFDKDGIIDDALIYHVRALSKYGDVIFCMDNNCEKTELDKIKPFAIHTVAVRHGEYDFGSYKRCFQYARDHKLLEKYDTVYLVNDSVFGPLFDMADTLNKIESMQNDAVGMVVAKHKTHSYMESWFVKLNKKIFLSDWFDKFISNITKEQDKYAITIKYEHGLSNLIKNNDCSWGGLYIYYGRYTYNNPKDMFLNKNPFIKKASFTRHNGAFGKQIKYVLNHTNADISKSIMNTANRVYGEQYMNKFLTNNPVKIMFRNITYLITKLKNGGI